MTVIPQCFRCVHFRGLAIDSDGYRCAAFGADKPIPREILLGEHDHRDPFPGDNGVRFKPKDRDET